ncbi:hypothetical protein OPT61_g8711 [Boeremia exigua]|uniref:Uncharacterized protein n=1 Tax=Boeremia exigua TaxID=749465 RepID=A0ACC2HX53_9PLEO|nr:hypothetical protein OPT61_g8711 [Boeremia exigua]
MPGGASIKARHLALFVSFFRHYLTTLVLVTTSPLSRYKIISPHLSSLRQIPCSHCNESFVHTPPRLVRRDSTPVNTSQSNPFTFTSGSSGPPSSSVIASQRAEIAKLKSEKNTLANRVHSLKEAGGIDTAIADANSRIRDAQRKTKEAQSETQRARIAKKTARDALSTLRHTHITSQHPDATPEEVEKLKNDLEFDQNLVELLQNELGTFDGPEDNTPNFNASHIECERAQQQLRAELTQQLTQQINAVSEEARNAIQKLTQEMQNFQARHEEDTAQISRLQSQNDQILEAHNFLQSRNDQILEAHNSLQSQNEHLKKDLNQIREAHNYLQSQIPDAQRHYEEAQCQIQQLQAKAKEDMETTTRLEAHVESVQGELEAVNNEFEARVLAEAESANMKIAELEERLRSNVEAFNRNTTQKNELDKELKDVRIELDAAKEGEKKLVATIKRYEESSHDLDYTNNELRATLKAKEEELRGRLDELATSTTRLAGLQLALQASKEGESEARKVIAEQELVLRDMEDAAEEMISERAGLQEDLENLTKEMGQSMRVKDCRIESLESEMSERDELHGLDGSDGDRGSEAGSPCRALVEQQPLEVFFGEAVSCSPVEPGTLVEQQPLELHIKEAASCSPVAPGVLVEQQQSLGLHVLVAACCSPVEPVKPSPAALACHFVGALDYPPEAPGVLVTQAYFWIFLVVILAWRWWVVGGRLSDWKGANGAGVSEGFGLGSSSRPYGNGRVLLGLLPLNLISADSRLPAVVVEAIIAGLSAVEDWAL